MKFSFSVALAGIVISFLMPWYFVSALAAAIYSFRPERNHKEIWQTSALILLLHGLCALVLDLRSSMLISERMSGLFGLPVFVLFYFVVGLIPGLVFLVTSYVVLESRSLVKREKKRADKRV